MGRRVWPYFSLFRSRQFWLIERFLCRTVVNWLISPLSGMVVAPTVGAYADRSRSKWGRRRPFMIGGSIIVAICLLVLGWAKEIVTFIHGSPNTSLSIFLAVLTIYVLDFAINAVQFSCRSLIIDSLPTSKQQSGSAWASRMASFGHLVGYALGALDLEKLSGNWLGDSQFKRMTVVSAFALFFAVAVTSSAVREIVLTGEGNTKTGLYEVFAHIARTVANTPKRIRAICFVQFWAWLGWFPFMVYSAEWVGETYLKYDAPTSHSGDRLGEVGKLGSTALIVFSIVTTIASVVLPWAVRLPGPDNAFSSTTRPLPIARANARDRATNSWKPRLVEIWFASHFLFSGAMIISPFANSMKFATTLVAICGIPWSLSAWASMTFIGVEINRAGCLTTDKNIGMTSTKTDSNNRSIESEEKKDTKEAGERELGQQSGIYLGILNLFTTIPQFISSLLSGCIFAIVEPGNAGGAGTSSASGISGIAISLVLGALSALMAARATWKLRNLLAE